jgi:uncharacterized protein (TIGR03000 family)
VAEPLPATIEVLIPDEAELWFQEVRTYQTGSRRLFNTPPLPAGQTFAYDLIARWLAPGGEMVVSEQVFVRAGEHVVVDLASRLAPAPVPLARLDYLERGQAAQVRALARTSVAEFPPSAATPRPAVGRVIPAGFEGPTVGSWGPGSMVIREYGLPGQSREGPPPSGPLFMRITEFDAPRGAR